MLRLTLLVALTLACGASGPIAARAQDVSRAAGESDLAFAARSLQLPKEAHPHTTDTTWNGHPTLFVDYETPAADPERQIVALQQQPGGGYRILQVTLGEQEGATPGLVAIGLANADRDPAQELIVILAWPQQHYDVEGTLYEVRIFDDPKPGQTALTQLKSSHKFDATCDCGWRDGTSKRFRFKTIAAVKAELKRLGY